MAAIRLTSLKKRLIVCVQSSSPRMITGRFSVHANGTAFDAVDVREWKIKDARALFIDCGKRLWDLDKALASEIGRNVSMHCEERHEVATVERVSATVVGTCRCTPDVCADPSEESSHRRIGHFDVEGELVSVQVRGPVADTDPPRLVRLYGDSRDLNAPRGSILPGLALRNRTCRSEGIITEFATVTIRYR